MEAFETYALGRVFSFVLVKLGIEPLHASTVVIDGVAVAFLGASTFGKSSLAASFLAAKFPLLTDDVLRVELKSDGAFALPGPHRLKLFPYVARQFLGEHAEGRKMNPNAVKQVYALSSSQGHSRPAPLAVMYAITPPRLVHRKQKARIASISPAEAILRILRFTHNQIIAGSARLQRQFEAARQLVDAVPVRELSYPRDMEMLPGVRDAVLKDLQQRNTWLPHLIRKL